MFVCLEELFLICKNETKEKNIILKILDRNGKIKEVPMCNGHYIISNVWYAEVNENSLYPLNNNKFIDELEVECINYPNDWGSLYVAPMEELGNCELRFTDDICNVEEGEEKYEITNIKNEDNIYICLREL